MASGDATGASRREVWRRELGGRIVQGGFEGLAALGGLHPSASPARHNVEKLRDVSYGPAREHRLDVWRPRSPGPHPALLYVHGGGFRILSKETHWVMALAFARRGYTVFNINYRLAPRHPYPAALEDTLRAWAWVLEHGERFGADVSSRGVVVAGESAGANLVSALTVATCWEREEPWAREVFELGQTPRAVLAACGILQVSEPERLWARRKNAPQWLKDRVLEVSQGYLGESGAPCPLADPLVILEREERAPQRALPPCFLPVGTRDVLQQDSERMATAWQARGGRAELRLYAGEVHAFHAFVWREQARQCWRDTYYFLDSI